MVLMQKHSVYNKKAERQNTIQLEKIGAQFNRAWVLLFCLHSSKMEDPLYSKLLCYPKSVEKRTD